MNLGPYAFFVVSAYAVAALIVAGMIAWVVLDHWRQARVLAALEQRGVARRSEHRPGEATT